MPDLTELLERGYLIVPAFLDAGLVQELQLAIDLRDSRGEFRAAAVGAGVARTVRPSVRGDRIQWLDRPQGPAESQLLERLETLRLALNEQGGLGVFDLECHYAMYPPGARYARHLDRSAAGAERIVSVVLYLNPQWQDSDGGQLRLYSNPVVEVAPCGGTLVLFMSESLEHEVLETRAERRSLTGWYRRRARQLNG